MIPGLKQELTQAIGAACRTLFDLEPPRVVLETPPKVELGDVASPVAFDLAKRLKRPPRKIAEELAAALVLPPAVERAKVEGGGYLNFFLRRAETLSRMLRPAPHPEPSGHKVIVEHTNINPNK
ncbi:MAG TPA: arginine--tRNA ligase, partial [Thermoanaerobaculia bacterium]|nr:arginine--tRNA ligase [Thermoanaerobaculia bacterium]